MTTLRPKRFVSIEGNIGSGKSTLLANLKTALKDNPNVVFLKEPVDEWEKIKDSNGCTMLQKFYGNQERYSFPFQMMAYISRLAAFKNAVAENPQATVFITERSLDTDKYVFAQMLYDDNKIEDVNFQIYRKWFDTFAQEFPVAGLIYVNTLPEICHQRITKRSRDGEGCIPLDYLQNCSNYHDYMMSVMSDSPILTLDGNVDIYEKADILGVWIYNVKQFIYALEESGPLETVLTL
jgi:deoxycitidine kinase/deoxyguanosine kinase